MRPTFILLFRVILYFLPLQLCAQDISYMSSGGKLKPLQAIMDIRHYTLALDVDIDQKSIDGYAEIKLILSRPSDTLLFDLIHFLDVKKILVDAAVENFNHAGDEIYITNHARFSAGVHVVRIYYGGHPPVAVRPPWLGGFTWTKDREGNPWMAINCQLQGAKIYFPCKDHPSDEPDEGVDLYITIPRGLSVAGPGLLQSVKREANKKAVWHWKTNYTISNYCIVFNIGKYKVFTRNYLTCDGHTVPIQLYILEQDTARAKHLLDVKERDTHILEKYFGEYPWVREKIGVAEVPNSGMEHQTMITFMDSLIFTKFPGNQDYSAVYFHEYAHEWWANKITNKDWAHMWIQEGIATYAEALAMRELGGEKAYDSAIIALRAGIRNEKPVVQGDALGMKDEYNGDIYSKGAFLMHTLRSILGDSIFFPALKKFITGVKYPYEQFFTTDDVQQFFSKETGRDLQPLFDFYLRTTHMTTMSLRRTGPDTYYLLITDVPMRGLPLDIVTSAGVIHTTMEAATAKPLKITSTTLPIPDPGDHYFKKVVYQ
ncbi:MAG TPA: M1 family metallopeptidase [Chitinophagaceae bacterium]|nr:M1 family metallopeptidase [Chitinophagaceae bacterium]